VSSDGKVTTANTSAGIGTAGAAGVGAGLFLHAKSAAAVTATTAADRMIFMGRQRSRRVRFNPCVR
jgi:hypothetical protein